MSATVVEIADLVVEDLNQSSVQDAFSGDFAFNAVRTYLPDAKLEDAAKKLICFVVPRLQQAKLASRQTASRSITIEVGFVVHPPSVLADQWIDGMVELVSRVGEYLLGKSYTMADRYSATCMETETPIAYDYEALRTANEFRSFVMCTFRKEN